MYLKTLLEGKPINFSIISATSFIPSLQLLRVAKSGETHLTVCHPARVSKCDDYDEFLMIHVIFRPVNIYFTHCHGVHCYANRAFPVVCYIIHGIINALKVGAIAARLHLQPRVREILGHQNQKQGTIAVRTRTRSNDHRSHGECSCVMFIVHFF